MVECTTFITGNKQEAFDQYIKSILSPNDLDLASKKDGAYAKDRRNLLVCTLISLFCIQTVNMNVTTIVPSYIAKNHKSLDEIHSSLIMV